MHSATPPAHTGLQQYYILQWQAPSASHVLQIAGTQPPACSEAATSACEAEEEEGHEEATASAAHKAADSSQAAKRRKMSVPASEDIQDVQQPVEEARKVAAATKDALGLKGDRFSPRMYKLNTWPQETSSAAVPTQEFQLSMPQARYRYGSLAQGQNDLHSPVCVMY